MTDPARMEHPTRVMHPIAVVTTARSDYTAQAAIVRALSAHPALSPQLVVAGAHLSARHGGTVSAIESDDVPIAARIDYLSESDDSPHGHGRAAARALELFTAWMLAHAPALVVLYGDRFELLPIATAAVIARVPIAHVSGGDITEGAIDEQVRHALTKMAHLHFPHTPGATRRVLQMGEEPWRVTTVGDPLLDAFVHGPRPTPEALAEALGFVPDARTLVVTFHPPTLELDTLPAQLHALCTALHAYDGPVVITAPAPDPGADAIRASLTALAHTRPRTVFVENLGGFRFRGLLHCAGAVVGNSSSGLVEAPAAQLGAVNLGARQQGRERARNVVDAPLSSAAITAAIATVLSEEFRRTLVGLESPYGRGDAAPTLARAIHAALTNDDARSALLRKRFHTP